VVVRRRKEKAAANGNGNGTGERRESVSGRRMSFVGFLGRSVDKDKDAEKENSPKELEHSGPGKGIKRGLQKVLGLAHGHSHSHSNGNPLSPTTPTVATAAAQASPVTAEPPLHKEISAAG
jgi:hypothetical protein